MKRVVITGMSVASALGTDCDEFFENLCNKKIVLEKIEKNTHAREKLKLNHMVPYPKIDDSEFGNKLNAVKRRGSKASYAASYVALKALKDSGIEEPDYNSSVYIGSGAPVMDSLSEAVLSLDEKNKMNLLAIPMSMHNSSASWVSMTLGTHGRCSEIGSACASGTLTIGMGYEDIVNGKCDLAFCGGADYLVDKNMTIAKGFEYLKAVTSSSDGKSYPFSEERNGFMFCEGAASVVVLEELEHAKKRNAKIYAEITGTENCSDAYSLVSMPEDGKYITEMISKLVGNKKVDYYNAHGTGTTLNDSVEAKMIQDVFGSKDNQPLISSTKGIIGHTLGASGTIEAIVCVESILKDKVHGNNLLTPFSNLNINPETCDAKIDVAISASFGFGGHNSALMIERYKG